MSNQWFGRFTSEKNFHTHFNTMFKDIAPNTEPCFGSHYDVWGEGDFYFSLYYTSEPTFVEKLVSQFNQVFTNIHVSIMGIHKYYRYETSLEYKYTKLKPKDYLSIEVFYVVYKIEYHPKYSDFARYCLDVSVGEFFRTSSDSMSISAYFNYSAENLVEETYRVNQYAAKNLGNYLAKVTYTFDHILSWNNIELMNEKIISSDEIKYWYTKDGSSYKKLQWESLARPSTVLLALGAEPWKY